MTLNDVFGYKDMKNPIFWRDILCEILCSMLLLVFLTPLMVDYPEGRYGTMHTGLTIGLGVCAILETFGHISGCHLNPALTFVLMCKREIKIIKGLFYTFAQCVGCAAGSGLIFGLASPEHRSLFFPFVPNENIGTAKAIGMEALFTFILMTVIQGVTDKTKQKQCNMPGVPVGFTVAANIMAGGAFTPVAFNPLIALGPAVITRNFTQHWIYWIGAYTGAVLSVIVYSIFSIIGKLFDSKQKIHHPSKGRQLNANLDEVFALLQDMRSNNNNDDIYKEKKEHPNNAPEHIE